MVMRVMMGEEERQGEKKGEQVQFEVHLGGKVSLGGFNNAIH